MYSQWKDYSSKCVCGTATRKQRTTIQRLSYVERRTHSRMQHGCYGESCSQYRCFGIAPVWRFFRGHYRLYTRLRVSAAAPFGRARYSRQGVLGFIISRRNEFSASLAAQRPAQTQRRS